MEKNKVNRQTLFLSFLAALLIFGLLLGAVCIASYFQPKPKYKPSGEAIFHGTNEYQDLTCARMRSAWINEPFAKWYMGE